MYYRGCSAVAFVLDMTNKKSLEELDSWVTEFLDKMQLEYANRQSEATI